MLLYSYESELVVGLATDKKLMHHHWIFARVSRFPLSERDLRALQRFGHFAHVVGSNGDREEQTPAERIGQGRIEEIIDSGADVVAVSCPFCLVMIRDGVSARDAKVEVKDVSELYADAINVSKT